PVHSRGAPPRDGIEMPVDRVPEREIPVSEEIEPALAERVGTSQHLLAATNRWRRRAGRALEEPRGAVLAEAFEEHFGRTRLVAPGGLGEPRPEPPHRVEVALVPGKPLEMSR